MPQIYSGLEPAISILMPAFNEQASIAASVRSMLQLTYSEFEVIVINDGSSDATLEMLVQEFSLVPFPESYRLRLQTAPIRTVYRSPRFRNLRVVDKENGGKADALNAGINAARYPLFCGVDADSVLERDSLQRVVKPFLRDPRMVASGGTVRILNGCEVQDGVLTRVALPRNFLALCQVVEYLRAFLFGRLGWSQLNAMLIISGAFGLFRTNTVVEVGGYRTRTIGEDMELVVRMHRILRQRGQPYRMEFVPEPVCWTEAPEDLATLRNQRIRWQHGLCESLTSNWGLMFSSRGGAPGWLAFPFMVLFEWLGPLIEVAGCVLLLLQPCRGWFLGRVRRIHVPGAGIGRPAFSIRPLARGDVFPSVPEASASGAAGPGRSSGKLRLSSAQHDLEIHWAGSMGRAAQGPLGNDEAQGPLEGSMRPAAQGPETPGRSKKNSVPTPTVLM